MVISSAYVDGYALHKIGVGREKADHLGLVQRFDDGAAGCARYRPAWFPCSAGCRWVFVTDWRRLRRALSASKALLRELIEPKNQVVDLLTWAQQGVASPCRSRRGGATTAPPPRRPRRTA